jgi:hypothetical protein
VSVDVGRSCPSEGIDYLLSACPHDRDAKPAAAPWFLRRASDVLAEGTEGGWKRKSGRSA